MKFKAGILGVVYLSCLVLPCAVTADIYRFTDSDGVVHYTDNLVEVPESQRAGVHQYFETKASANAQPEDDGIAAEVLNEAAEADDEPRAAEETAYDTFEAGAREDADDGGPNETPHAAHDSLKAEKEELDHEYAALENEKRALLARETGSMDEAELEAYREAVLQFNKRITDFERRRQDLQEKVDEYHSERSR